MDDKTLPLAARLGCNHQQENIEVRRRPVTFQQVEDTTEARIRRHRDPLPLWKYLPGLRPPPRTQKQNKAGEELRGQVVQKWEQVPLGVWLMNEICDAVTIGSDFAFWTGLAIIVVFLGGLIYWYAE
ncbi:hypothetical protein N0V94_001577 [Neodidymelliopsis sp. IMI 364377]|nr:hypothetical protein N0V94_001577 [Neodidymelliopsis sp. IMI 364377]